MLPSFCSILLKSNVYSLPKKQPLQASLASPHVTSTLYFSLGTCWNDRPVLMAVPLHTTTPCPYRVEPSLSGILTFASPHLVIFFHPPGEQRWKPLSNFLATDLKVFTYFYYYYCYWFYLLSILNYQLFCQIHSPTLSFCKGIPSNPCVTKADEWISWLFSEAESGNVYFSLSPPPLSTLLSHSDYGPFA